MRGDDNIGVAIVVDIGCCQEGHSRKVASRNNPSERRAAIVPEEDGLVYRRVRSKDIEIAVVIDIAECDKCDACFRR